MYRVRSATFSTADAVSSQVNLTSHAGVGVEEAAPKFSSRSSELRGQFSSFFLA